MSHYSSRPIYPVPPPGWIPPYQGAPPPMPTNMMINPNLWQMGSWSFNPAYNAQSYPAATAWQPAPAWVAPRHVQQPPQQQANYNPYKKPIKPPSAEYLAMKLPINGLELHGMVPAKDPYGDEEAQAAPQTPWIWNPATLSNDAISSSSTSSDSSSPNSKSTDSTPSSRRHASEPAMSDVERTPRPRHATYPSANGSTPNGSSSDQPARPANGPEQDTESFTSRRELKPTFSLKIVRTPEHSKDSSRSPRSSSSGSPRRSQGSVSSVDSLAARMDQMNTSDIPSSKGPTPLFRNSSMPSIYSSSNQTSSITGAPALVDEPASILSPLVLATPQLPPARTIGRVSTYPDISNSSLGTIAENPSPPPPPENPRQRRRQRRATSPDPSITPQPINYAEATPRVAPLHHHHTPPESTYPSRESSRKSSRSSGHQHTPPDPYSAYRSSSPPRESSRKSSRSSGQQYTPPDAYSAHPQPSPESREPSRKSSRSSGHQHTPPEPYRAPSPESREPSRKSSRSSGQQRTPPDAYTSRRPQTPESASRRGVHAPPEPAPEPYDPYRPKQPFVPTPPGPYVMMGSSPRLRHRQPPPDAPPPEEPPRWGHYATPPEMSYDSHRPKQPFTTPPRETSFVPSPVRRPPQQEPSPSPQRVSFQSTPPRDPLFPSASTASSSSTAAPSALPYPYPDNPLPPPPKPKHIKYVRMPPPPDPRYTGTATLRIGFWNRRGDHMTPEGYVVYAPEDMAYPEELENYPAEDSGYQDECGTIVSYDPERPELPESLPLHGKLPRRPYKDFIQYAEREVLLSTLKSPSKR
ncbi:hypothetical protein Hypma_003428 [Hypsizygus marmoreus]|uniref:Uncharacterized protein n=1 Tax=Hypsizygus marmoreus TaxID=39966 RepID=A0A369J220_HYPMA|nr:hypothetical protein Hypma_003428 [Hypsizygus marmoreus]